MEDVRLLFFLHMVEAALVTFAGLTLFGIKASPRKVLLVGAVQGLLVYLIRGIYIINHLPLGTHSLLTLVTLILLMRFVLKIDWSMAMMAALSAESLVFLGSNFPLILNNWLDISMKRFLGNPWLFAFIGLTENTVVVLAGLFCILTGFNLKKLTTGVTKKSLPVFIFIILLAFFNIYFTVYYEWYQSSKLFALTTHVLTAINFIIAIVTIYLIVSVFKFIKKSEQQEKELLIRKNNEALVETLRLLRHDFSNHITVLSGLVSLGRNADAESYLKTLSTEMKSLSKLTSLKQQNLVAFFINKLREADNNGIEIKFNIQSFVDNFSISTDKITKIFGNLIDNAFFKLKNSEQPEKWVLIEITEDGNNYYFTVADNGPLVPKEICEKVFNRGFTTKGSQGSGLGLYIAKKAVEQKNGRLFLEQSPEQGVRFICSFPVAKEKV